MLVNPSQYAKALSPMRTTPSGIETPVNNLQPSKAKLSSVVTPFGISYVPEMAAGQRTSSVLS